MDANCRPVSTHVAIVTGANHGIGAASASALAAAGYAVLCTYWRVRNPVDPAVPQAYRNNRAMDAEHVVAGITAGGGRATAVEADLSDSTTPARLFDVGRAAAGAGRRAGQQRHGLDAGHLQAEPLLESRPGAPCATSWWSVHSTVAFLGRLRPFRLFYVPRRSPTR
jgi:NAD(P)-dependent dehydrogenase (short-subunit alcohol dehydrogenase family)